MTLLIINIFYYFGILAIVKKLAAPVDEALKEFSKLKNKRRF